jgi:hypothetical protein
LNYLVSQSKSAIWSSIPAECRLHHPWRPGTVTVSWEACECEPAQGARGGHIKVACGAAGCTEVWLSPRHRPIGIIGHHRPGYR